MGFSDWLVMPSVHPSAGRHAAPEGAAGAADAYDRGQHPAAAGGATADPGGAAEGTGPGPAGQCCLLVDGKTKHFSTAGRAVTISYRTKKSESGPD